MREVRTRTWYVICIRNDGFPTSLEVRKLYRAVRDDDAQAKRLIRIVDESGEDYLYPADWFVKIALAPTVRRALASTA